MPAHQGRQGRLIAAPDEGLQQLPAVNPRVARRHRPAQMQVDLAQLACRHLGTAGRQQPPPPLALPERGRLDAFSAEPGPGRVGTEIAISVPSRGGHAPGHVPGQVLAAVVKPFEDPHVPVPAELLHGPDIAAGQVEGRRDLPRRLSQRE